jgi:hypothetical protein
MVSLVEEEVGMVEPKVRLMRAAKRMRRAKGFIVAERS